MTDFLKANPYVSREEYMWEWTLAQVHLSSMDFTHTIYLKDGKNKVTNKDYDDPMDFMKDMGMPTI